MTSPRWVAFADADRRIATMLFALVLLTYAFFFGGGGWNANAHFDLTRAVVEDGSIRIDRFARNTGDVAVVGGHVFLNKPPGASLMGAIPYAFAFAIERAAGIDPDDAIVQTLNAWIVTAAVCGGLGALIPAFLFLHARRRYGVPAHWAAPVALLVAWATPLFAYSTVYFLHVPSGALILISYVLGMERSMRRPLAAGLVAGLSCATNYLAVPLAGILLVALFWTEQREGRWKAALRYIAGTMPGVIVLAAYQYFAFGAIFRIPIAMNRTFTTSGAALGILNPDPAAFYGITLSPYRGLFYLSPILIMAIGGFVVLIRRREGTEALALAASIGVFVAFNLTFNNWDGGFGIGPRYLVPIIPLCGILMLQMHGALRLLWIALGAASFVTNFAAVSVDPIPSGSIPAPLTQYIFPLLWRGHFPESVPITPPWSAQLINGHVAVNPHSIDQIVPYILHPPWSAETIWAAFNLGEPVFGVGSAASLLPVLVLMIGGTWLIMRETRAS